MSFYDSIRIGASGAADDYTIDRSLRFNNDDSAYLSKTLSSDGNRTTMTLSVWIKRGDFGEMMILDAYENDANRTRLMIDAGNRMQFVTRLSSNDHQLITTGIQRDPSAWYHFVWAIDTTDSTASNRVKMYINGEQQTDFVSTSYPDQNEVMMINKDVLHTIGIGQDSAGLEVPFDGYLAEINFIDGFQYDPSYFGETDVKTGQWNPKKYTGSYGSKGFYLNFSDNSGTTATTLGKDSSGNSNNFTPVNLSTGDAVKDSPSNNFAVLNPLSKSSGVTLAEANLYAQGTSAWRNVVGNFHMSSGKWYWEIYIKQVGTSIYGIMPATRGNGRQDFYADIYTGSYSDEWGYRNNGTLYNSASGTSSWGDSYTTGDILSFALDMDNGTLDIKKNNSATGSQITGISTTKEYRAAFTYFTSGTKSNINFGQDSTFAGQKTAQGNTDGSGQGDFYYAPPSGYKALCSANLADPTILLPNKHFDTLLYTGNGSTTQNITGYNFQPDWVWIKSRSGSGHHSLVDSVRGDIALNSSRNAAEYSVSAFNFNATSIDVPYYANDYSMNTNSATYVAWNWNAGNTDGKTYTVKVVSDSGNKYRFNDFGTSAVTLDLAEGGTYTFDGSDSSMSGHPFVIGTAANGSVYSTGVTYQLDGASVSYSAYTSGYATATTRKLIITVPASAPQLYYWCSIHSGMGGAINTNSTLGSSNFDGTIQSTVKANPTAGFSIVSYEGNNVQGATVGHGLGVAPSVVIVKNRESTYNWAVWHQGLLSAAYVVNLNLNSAQGSVPGIFNSTLPTSTVFSLGGGSQGDRFLSNEPNKDFIAYVFSEVAGYSKFGSYTGNGNADGTFVFLGFRPAWIMIKKTDSAEGWEIFDNKRDPNNVIEDLIEANTSAASITSIDWLDFLSNGIKHRIHYSNINTNGSKYIYLAFSESPFKNSRAR